MFQWISRAFMMAAMAIFFALIVHVMITPVGSSAREAFMLRMP